LKAGELAKLASLNEVAMAGSYDEDLVEELAKHDWFQSATKDSRWMGEIVFTKKTH